MKRLLAGLVVAAVLIGGGAVAYLYLAGGSGEPSAPLTSPSNGGFAIVQGESVASFEIDEVLRGNPNHVIGSTHEVAGSVSFDPEDPAAATITQITVNARTFTTDNQFRDRAIRGPVVLNSADDAFELITFVPTSISGLSGPAETGVSVTFQVTGDLTIKGVTRSVTFDVSATLVSEDRLEGRAETQVLREDFDIGIPNAPGVADVTNEVLISLDFVAVRA
jgi:polyisoprenoid-binding protein YceI